MNDTDLWNDIEFFETHGREDLANELIEIWNNLFNEHNPEKARKLIKEYENKHETTLNII